MYDDQITEIQMRIGMACTDIRLALQGEIPIDRALLKSIAAELGPCEIMLHMHQKQRRQERQQRERQERYWADMHASGQVSLAREHV